MIQVHEQLGPALEREISDYLAAAPAAAGACGEHDPRWLAILREALGHRPMVLVARNPLPSEGEGGRLPSRPGECLLPSGKSEIRNQESGIEDPHPNPLPQKGEGAGITGYLPLALVASRLFGRFLVSLPYLNRAGVVASDPAVAAALIDRAIALAAERDAQYLELRHGQPVEHPGLPARRDEKVRMVLDLPPDPDALWKGLDAKVRNQVRKGDKSELSVRWGGLDVLDDFYTVFAVNMRDLGTPVYPRKLFASILERLNGEAELAVVDCQGQPVAGALLVHHAAWGGPRATEVPSASSLRQFSATSANMWMYHRLLLRAMERGRQQFDFGRSSQDSGTYRFKKQWGAQPQPTVWQYHVRRGEINAMRPDSPRYRRRIAVWQRLPVWLTRWVGPHIVRGIP